MDFFWKDLEKAWKDLLFCWKNAKKYRKGPSLGWKKSVF